MSTCPKCQFELDEAAVECPACGIILAKYWLHITPES